MFAGGLPSIERKSCTRWTSQPQEWTCQGCW